MDFGVPLSTERFTKIGAAKNRRNHTTILDWHSNFLTQS